MQVVLILEELGAPYALKSVRFQDVKQKPFLNINPNGRVPGMTQYFVPFSVVIPPHSLLQAFDSNLTSSSIEY